MALTRTQYNALVAEEDYSSLGQYAVLRKKETLTDADKAALASIEAKANSLLGIRTLTVADVEKLAQGESITTADIRAIMSGNRELQKAFRVALFAVKKAK